MSSPSQQPGWYPAPDGSAQPWWWDGTQWGQAPTTPEIPAYPTGLPHPGPPAPPTTPPDPQTRTTIRRLASVVQVLLIASAAVTLVALVLDLVGIGAVSAYLGGDDGAGTAIDTYNLSSGLTGILSLVLLLATGVLWMIWQHRLARQAVGRTRRSPGWHVWSWVIPIVNFWFPYQNVSDLWRAAGRTRPGWQIAWWLLWISGSLTGSLAAQVSVRAMSLEEFLVSLCVSVLSGALTLGAALIALLLVRRLTQAYT